MAQRQWRSDDTSPWPYSWGSGADGDLVISSDTTEAPIDSACTATAGTYSITATNASFAAGQIILIHKTRGATTTPAGTWELNFIASYVAGTITTTLPMINSYQNSGVDVSQVRVLKQYNNVTVNSAVTYSSKLWDGTTNRVGGIMGFFCKGTLTGPGTISASAKGFAGGAGGNPDNNQYCGEGSGAVSAKATSNPAGNGGGGQNVSSAGGGNATTMTSSDSCEGTLDYNAGGTLASFGGGGGGGASSIGGAGRGGYGGGAIFIFARSFAAANQINITNAGENGGAGGASRGGSGGAGGCTVIKSMTAPLGTNIITASAGAAGTGASSNNTAGSVGRIHLDYNLSYSGSTSPALDVRQDSSLLDLAGGSFLLNFL